MLTFQLSGISATEPIESLPLAIIIGMICNTIHENVSNRRGYKRALSGLRSNRGASYKLFKHLDSGKFEINLAVPLTLEFEEV